MRQHLTDRLLKALRGAQKPFEVWDMLTPGLLVLVLPSGRRTFYVRYWLRGRYRRRKLGVYGSPGMTLRAARKAAAAAVYRASQGAEIPSRRGIRFAEAAADYIGRHAKRELQTWREYQRIIERDLKPLRNMPIAVIRRGDLLAILREVEARGTVRMRNRVASVMASIFRWAIDEELAEDIAGNPAADLPRRQETSRRRILDDGEIRSLWLYPFGDSVARALRVLLLTAQRSGAVCGMRRAEIAGNSWTVPAERMKGRKSKKREHLVPLSAAALKAIEAAKGVIIFPGRSGEPILETSLATAVTRAGFDWTPRDLRKTASTLMAANGVDEEIIGKVLAHTAHTVTGRVYNLYAYEAEKRHALEVLAGAVERILAGP